MKTWFAEIAVAACIVLISSTNVCKAEESGILYPKTVPEYEPWLGAGTADYGAKFFGIEVKPEKYIGTKARAWKPPSPPATHPRAWKPEPTPTPPATQAPTWKPEPTPTPPATQAPPTPTPPVAANRRRATAAAAQSNHIRKKKLAKSQKAAKQAYKGAAYGKRSKAANSKHISKSHLSGSAGASKLKKRKYLKNVYAKVKTAKSSRNRLLSVFKKKAADISNKYAHSSEYGKQHGDYALARSIAAKKLDSGSASASKKGAAASKAYGAKKAYVKAAGKAASLKLYADAATKSAKFARKASGGNDAGEKKWNGGWF